MISFAGQLFTPPVVSCNLRQPGRLPFPITAFYCEGLPMKHLGLAVLGAVAAATLASCGGGGGGAALGVAQDVALPANATTAAAVSNTPFSFSSGVAAFGTSGSTTLAFTSTSTTPAFKVETAGGSAQGTTTFGSCIFAVTAVTGTVGNLKVGDVITVNPCNVNVNAAGAVANGVAASRSAALVLGNAVSQGATITVAVTAGGSLTLNGAAVGTVTLTPVSG
jgi:hypothetical protein